MLRQSPKSNDPELQFAALGAAFNLLISALVIIALWQIFVLLIHAGQLLIVFPLVLAEAK